MSKDKARTVREIWADLITSAPLFKKAAKRKGLTPMALFDELTGPETGEMPLGTKKPPGEE